jgi:Na+-translocating ferredoxin:NAD+ oxidoreductase RNF subunit RnfB
MAVSNDTFHLHDAILTRESTYLSILVFIDEDSCIGCTQVSACDTGFVVRASSWYRILSHRNAFVSVCLHSQLI